MNQRRRAVVAAALMALVSTGAAAQSVTARTVRFASEALGGQATFAILVPPGYDTSERRYPVVYLLHGGTQNHTAFPARSWFGKEVLHREMIVVMPHVPQTVYGMRSAGGSSALERLIVNDLVGYVDANYRTVASREARALAGLSIGGFGAVMVGLTRHELFGTVGAFGGAFSGDREAVLARAAAAVPIGESPYFYLACGVEDALLPASRAFAARLTELDIAHEYREVPGGHTWEVWDPQTLAFFDAVTRRPGFTATRDSR